MRLLRAGILEVLGDDTGRLVCELYDVTEHGNFEGKNILNLPLPYQEFAEQRGMEKAALQAQMREARERLLARRNQRVRPGKDDKVLVSWNALAIDALARAAVQLNEPRYLQAAESAGDFIWDSMRRPDGRLLHTWRHGKAKLNAYLDDYAYLIVAYLALYRATFGDHWIQRATELTETMIDRFADQQQGGFYFTSDDHETLVARTKDYQDGSVPSGNSMAALALLRLGRYCGKENYRALAESTVRSALSLVKRAPMAAGQMLLLIEEMLRPSAEYVLVAAGNEDDSRTAMEHLQSRLAPEECLIFVGPQGQISQPLAAAVRGKVAIENQPTLYICKDFSCQQPIVGVAAIRSAIEQRDQANHVS